MHEVDQSIHACFAGLKIESHEIQFFHQDAIDGVYERFLDIFFDRRCSFAGDFWGYGVELFVDSITDFWVLRKLVKKCDHLFAKSAFNYNRSIIFP